MKKILILLALIAAVAAPAAATDFAGPNVVVPVVGRTAGAFGSQWRTDLVVMNAARTGNPLPVLITFVRNDGVEQQLHATLAPRESRVLTDVVKELFGQDSATGIVRVAASSVDAKIAARARIYNIGSSAGQFGQIVHGMPVSKLSREAYLPGLSAAGGNRVNVGIANPANAEAAVFLSLFDESGEFHGGVGITVPARSVRQLNNIFEHFDDAPLDRGTIQITSDHGVYAYASIVRNDTGDADFVTATAAQIDTEGEVVAPSCANPAPIKLAVNPADGWIVIFHAGTNANVLAPELAARYGFTPIHIYNAAFPGFFAELPQATIAQLRCETAVQLVEQNARGNL